MIDTVKFVFPFTDCGQRVKDYGLEHPDRVLNRPKGAVRIPGYDDDCCAYVWPGMEGQRLWVELSLPKFLFGHNVYGPNDLPSMIQLAIEHIISALDATDVTIAINDIELTRVDVGCQFRLNQRNRPRVMNELYAALRREGHALDVIENNGYVETIYLGKRSRVETLRIYDKAKELLVHLLPESLPNRDQLLRYAKRTIRCEWVLRSVKLKQLGLRSVNAWSIEKARNFLREGIKKLHFRGNLLASITADIEEGFTAREWTYVQQWLNGIRLQDYMPSVNFDRLRKALLKKGIDIAVDQATVPPIDFNALTSNPRVSYPRKERQQYRVVRETRARGRAHGATR